MCDSGRDRLIDHIFALRPVLPVEQTDQFGSERLVADTVRRFRPTGVDGRPPASCTEHDLLRVRREFGEHYVVEPVGNGL